MNKSKHYAVNGMVLPKSKDFKNGGREAKRRRSQACRNRSEVVQPINGDRWDRKNNTFHK